MKGQTKGKQGVNGTNNTPTQNNQMNQKNNLTQGHSQYSPRQNALQKPLEVQNQDKNINIDNEGFVESERRLK